MRSRRRARWTIGSSAGIGACAGLAVAWGSLWWLVLCAVLALVVLAPRPSIPSTGSMVVGGGVGVLSAAAAGGALYADTGSGAVNAALVAALALALTLGSTAWRVARRLVRADLERGWEVARALEGEREATLAAALVLERSMMAGEIHDRLGHRLVLATVRLGRLWLDTDLAPDQRRVIADLRSDLADITEEIGTAVDLWDGGSPLPGRQRVPEDVVAAARAAGGEGTARLELDEVSGLARDAVGSVLEEALANAARHAPLAPVRVDASRDGDTVVLVVTNPVTAGSGSGSGAGTGLRRVRDRVERLGGSLHVDSGGDHSLTVRLPADARLRPAATAEK